MLTTYLWSCASKTNYWFNPDTSALNENKEQNFGQNWNIDSAAMFSGLRRPVGCVEGCLSSGAELCFILRRGEKDTGSRSCGMANDPPAFAIRLNGDPLPSPVHSHNCSNASD